MTQQAGEKAVKAVLVQRGVAFPYVHDLARLLTLFEEAGEEIPAEVRQAEGLTRYAVLSRYPGLAEPVNRRTLSGGPRQRRDPGQLGRGKNQVIVRHRLW